MKTIVALVDFSDVTAKVLKETEQLARGLGAQVCLAHLTERRPTVVDLGIASPTVMQDPPPRVLQAEKERLEEFRAALAGSGIAAQVEQWEDKGIDPVIENLDRLHADLVVVGSHRHSALFQLLAGGFGEELLKHAKCPVMVVPADESAA